jgi:hypothetical protein
MGVRMLRVEVDRAGERRDCLVDTRLCLIGDAEVAVPVRATGLEARLRSISMTASSLRPRC